MLKIQNVKYLISSNQSDLSYEELNKYGSFVLNKKFKNEKITDVEIIRKSLDARHKELTFNLSYKFNCLNEEHLLKTNKNISKYEEPLDLETVITKSVKNKKCLVVGSGPAGLFNAYILRLAGFEVTIIERGKKVEERIKDIESFNAGGKLNEESNIQFGEGGAGTFSDGKLQTNVNSPYIDFILKTFYKFGANKSILYEAKPHIGTDILRLVLIKFRNYLISLGVNIIFETKLIDFNNNIATCLCDGRTSYLSYDYLILAVGHSADDIYQLLKRKQVELRPKPFAVGVRIEQKQKIINLSQYKGIYDNLPAASYKLVSHVNDSRSLYTFCMCPGGEVVNASSREGCLVCNGMSNYKRDKENANSALLVNVNINDYYCGDVLDGLNYLRNIEQKAYLDNNLLPVQRVDDFIMNKTTVHLGNVIPSASTKYKFVNLNDILPSFVCMTIKEGLKDFNQKINNFATDDAILTGVETRSSAPVQVVRDENLATSISNLYVIGEGAGYAGGITTSALDGIKIALKLIEKEKK